MSETESMQAVLVLGAGGFVGRSVVQCLAATPGLRPIGAGRRAPAGGLGIEWRVCDATDAPSVAAAAIGCGYAVNCVAGDAATMLAATRALCAAAQAGGLLRVAHISSMAVYGGATGLMEEAHRLDSGGAGMARPRSRAKASWRRLARRAALVSSCGPAASTGRIASNGRAGSAGCCVSTASAIWAWQAMAFAT